METVTVELSKYLADKKKAEREIETLREENSKLRDSYSYINGLSILGDHFYTKDSDFADKVATEMARIYDEQREVNHRISAEYDAAILEQGHLKDRLSNANNEVLSLRDKIDTIKETLG